MQGLLNTQNAQVFSVDGSYSPSKCSVFLIPFINSSVDRFNMSIEDVNIDFGNFYKKSKSTDYMIPIDNLDGRCIMMTIPGGTQDFPIIQFPVSVSVSGFYKVWIKGYRQVSSFNVSLYIDDVLKNTNSGSSLFNSGFQWMSFTVWMQSGKNFDLGIKALSPQTYIDQISIRTVSSSDPSGDVTPSVSPYITVHCGLHLVDSSGNIGSQLMVHDFKSSIEEISVNSWYNFNIDFIDQIFSQPISNNCAIVLYTYGHSSQNYIYWNISDTDGQIGTNSLTYN